MARYRHAASFVADWREHCRPLDRNAKAKILALAESLERRTKAPGRRNGVLSLIGLRVLRVLLMGFHNHGNGLCCPSYRAIRDRTGLCQQSIANALARLEAAGVLVIVRRLVREAVDRISPITGLPERYIGTVSTSSLYAFKVPAAYAAHLAIPRGKVAGFPSRRQLDLLGKMEKLWSSKLSLATRQKQPPRLGQLLASALAAPHKRAFEGE